MFDKVTGLKNILWAIGIVVCLLALLVGFLVSAVTPYHGEAAEICLSPPPSMTARTI